MHAGLASFIATAPVLHAFEPFRRFMREAVRPYRTTPTGKVYLGEGQSVIVCPTYRQGPESTTVFRGMLEEAGFAAYDWGLGCDMGPGALRLSLCLRRFEERVIDIVETDGQPVTLLGWGLSGIYAREVAKRVTPLVRQVITLGTPFNGAQDPRRNCVMLRALDGDFKRLSPAERQRLRQRPPVPTTSIFSEQDDIVPWQLSVETESATSENFSVLATRHIDLPSHPKVIEVVTHRLSQPEDSWRPFAA